MTEWSPAEALFFFCPPFYFFNADLLWATLVFLGAPFVLGEVGFAWTLCRQFCFNPALPFLLQLGIKFLLGFSHGRC